MYSYRGYSMHGQKELRDNINSIATYLYIKKREWLSILKNACLPDRQRLRLKKISIPILRT